MVILFKDGFELGWVPYGRLSLSGGATAEIQSAIVYEGSNAARFYNPGGQNCTAPITISPQATVFPEIRFFLEVLPAPNTKVAILRIFGEDGTHVAEIRIQNTNGVMQLALVWSYPLFGGRIVDFPWQTGKFYRIKLGFDKVAGEYKVFVDNVEQIAEIDLDLTTAPNVSRIAIGMEWSGSEVSGIFDSIVISDVSALFSVTIESTPILGVPITMDGSPIGNTPVTINVEEGQHILETPQEVQT